MNPREDENTTLSLVRTGNPNQARACLAIRWLSASSHDCTLLTGSQLTLGRGAEADLRLESGGVSRKHAELVRQGPVFSIRDLESRNGTFVNGRRIRHAALSVNDVVRFGDAVGVVARVDPDRIESPVELAGALLGPDVADLLAQIKLMAPSDLPAVIVGETGVGKRARRARCIC